MFTPRRFTAAEILRAGHQMTKLGVCGYYCFIFKLNPAFAVLASDFLVSGLRLRKCKLGFSFVSYRTRASKSQFKTGVVFHSTKFIVWQILYHQLSNDFIEPLPVIE